MIVVDKHKSRRTNRVSFWSIKIVEAKVEANPGTVKHHDCNDFQSIERYTLSLEELEYCIAMEFLSHFEKQRIITQWRIDIASVESRS